MTPEECQNIQLVKDLVTDNMSVTEMSKIHFSLGDKLPTVYDVAITIFSICTTPSSSKMGNVSNQYALALMNVWGKSFGSDHVMCRRTVTVKLMKVIKNYFNQVYNKHHRKSRKKKKVGEVKAQEPRESI